MSTQIVIETPRRAAFAFTRDTHAELVAFAEERKIVEEPLHVVVEAWRLSKLH